MYGRAFYAVGMMFLIPLLVNCGFSDQYDTTKAVEPVVKFLEFLVDALALIGRMEEEVTQPRPREAESREAELVRKGIPFRQRQRA